MTREVYIEGRKISLAKRIGSGGEGDVFLAPELGEKAIKLYKPNLQNARQPKITAMVRDQLYEPFPFIGFPEKIAQDKSGKFLGFSMPLYKGYYPMHEVYGPKSRKSILPQANYKFLIRAATNMAKAVANVHQTSCVIGDLNHSGILVSGNSTVALIDADSFQYEESGKVYNCLVGVPDFTAPELHGKSLSNVIRKKSHDNFALAVAIFQLLFMARHPYAGVQLKGDLGLGELIQNNMFAYSRIRNTGMKPPGGVLTLDDMPTYIANNFERAFGLNPDQRPSAGEWVDSLNQLEGHLSKCSYNPMHLFPSVSQNCPWCRMEHTSGIVLFIAPFVPYLTGNLDFSSFDPDKIWKQILSIDIPTPERIMPKYDASIIQPSEAVNKAKGSGIKSKIMGVVIGLGAIVGFFVAPFAWWIWVWGLIGAFNMLKEEGNNASEFRNKYLAASNELDEAVIRFVELSGQDRFEILRSKLEQAVTEYKNLPAARTQALNKLKEDRKNKQLDEFLDKFHIRHASISGIGDAKTTTLISFGIETATDVEHHKIMRIPGFGDATARKIISWRKSIERRFVYNPAPQPGDELAEQHVNSEFAAKMRNLSSSLSSGYAELLQIRNTTVARLSAEDATIRKLALDKAQAEFDLKHLGISFSPRPLLYKQVVKTQPTYNRTATYNRPTATATMQTGSIPSCPRCGRAMVRRTAGRGSRRGQQFWGCSQYPRCKGTRN